MRARKPCISWGGPAGLGLGCVLAWQVLALHEAAGHKPQQPGWSAAAVTASVPAGIPGPELFSRVVRPVLLARCVGCHSAQRRAGGLDLSSREALQAGGDAGPAVVPGDPEHSPLYRQVAGLDLPGMPMGGERLAPETVAAIAAWIRGGAVAADPTEAAPVGAETSPPESGGTHWAFRPLRAASLPDVSDAAWRRNPVDRFVRAAQERKGLQPAPEAPRHTLLRRLSFDLTGLPPTPDEVEAFVRDPDPRAYEKWVDRMLASPRYGERQARYWLDLARYADSGGYEADWDRPGAYPYRDFVIRALNQDLPYDTFLRWQVAGDHLAPQNPLAIAATGFCTAGPTVSPGFNDQARYDELDDIVSTVGTSMLGLTVGCARCHDHKFDPVTQQDYYQLVATFAGSRRVQRPLPLEWGPAGATMLTLGDVAGKKRAGRGGWVTGSPLPAPASLVARSGGYLPGVTAFPDTRLGSPTGVPPRVALASWLTDPVRGAGALAARVAVNRVWQQHFGRGLVGTPADFGARGDVPSHPGLLEWLAADFAANGAYSLKRLHRLLVSSATYRQGSHTSAETLRLDPDNHLVSRREVLRLEGECVRDAILSVSGCLNEARFGPGVRPPMPEGAIHETEAKYGLVWPRDARDGPATWRRSIYVFVKRSNPLPFLQAFDVPDPTASCAQRNVTTVAPQALALLNDRFVRDQARHLADRIRREIGDHPFAHVRRAYHLTLGRAPSAAEWTAGVEFLQQQSRRIGSGAPASAASTQTGAAEAPGGGADDPAPHALVDYCQMLFGLHEFVYLD